MGSSAVSRIGQYELVSELAVGGMAQLFVGRVVGVHGFEQRVVIKKILPHLAQDETFRSMFVDEAKIAAQLHHPNIVQVFELGAASGELFIAMEYVEGLDVLRLLRSCIEQRRQLPVELAVYIAHQVLDALDYAHSACGVTAEHVDGGGPIQERVESPLHIVHRDISPGNILVSMRGDVKLTDFGIARAAERTHKTESGTLKGKFSYMSPEQVAGRTLDSRADIFSAGTVLSEMLMGRHLFAAPNDLEILLMVRDARLERLEKYGTHIPVELMTILRRALRRRSDDRFATAGQFRDALDDWLYARGERVGNRQLGAFVRELRDADAVVQPIVEKNSTLSGPSSLQQKLDVEAAAELGRRIYSADPRSEPEVEVVSDGISIEIEEMPVAEPAESVERAGTSSGPTQVVDLARISPARVLFDIAQHRGHGKLVAETDTVIKEAYFERGHPIFVRSNLMNERLGQFLVRHRIISRRELGHALEVLPHFGGRLGDTLIGLGFMKPMDAIRYLGEQVRDKLVELVAWREGSCSWFDAADNPWPAVALHLDTYDIVGRGCTALGAARVRAWAAEVGARRPVTRLPRVEMTSFGLGERVGSIFGRLDPGQTLARQLQPLGEDAQVDVLRMIYLLVETHAVQLV